MKKPLITFVIGAMLSTLLALCSCGGTDDRPASTASEPDAPTSASAASTPSADTSPVVIAAPSTSGALHVEGTHLAGEDGQAVQLRGASTHGMAWFPAYVNDALFGELRTDWGANVVRLALYTAESGGYCTDGDAAQLRSLVDDGVRYATDNDLYVIIDWHILSDANPNMHVDEAETFFQDVSAAYADHENVLYEICNEPNGGTTWADVKAYAERIVPIIRANDPDAVIIVGTPTWSQDVDVAATDPIAADNIMYALHFYAATHTDDLRRKALSALDAGLPLFVTEFGICDASGNGAIDEAQADAWISLLDERGVSYIMWNLSNKAESSAMLKTTCDKKSEFTDGDLSQAGSWLKRTLTQHAGVPAVTAKTNQEERAQERTDAAASRGPDAQGPVPTAQAPDGLECNVALRTQWVADGRPFYLYDLTIYNEGDAVSSWSVDLSFEDAITLSDSWNGTFEAEGPTLRITNASYNGAIPADGSAADVGFIVSTAP